MQQQPEALAVQTKSTEGSAVATFQSQMIASPVDGTRITLRSDRGRGPLRVPATAGPVLVSAAFSPAAGAQDARPGAAVVVYGVAAGARVPLDHAWIASGSNESTLFVIAGQPFEYFEFDAATWSGRVRVTAAIGRDRVGAVSALLVPHLAAMPAVSIRSLPSDWPAISHPTQRAPFSGIYRTVVTGESATAPFAREGDPVPILTDDYGRPRVVIEDDGTSQGLATEDTLDTFSAKFPTAATLGDLVTAIASTVIGSVGFLWDSALGRYVRAPGDSINGAKVQEMNSSAISGKLGSGASPVDTGANPSGTGQLRSYLHGYNGTTWDRLRAGVTTVGASVLGYLNVLPAAKYVATVVARTDGDYGHLTTGKYGALRSKYGEPLDAVVVTPGDATAVDFPGGLWVGTAGHVAGRLKDSVADVTWKNVGNGQFVPGWWVLVKATGTTATDIVGIKE